MNTTNILSVKFFIKKYKARDQKAPVYVRIAIGGKSADVSLKREVDISLWNPLTGQAKGSREDSRSLNAYLDQVRGEIANCYSDLKLQKKHLSAESVKNTFCGLESRENRSQTLIGLVNYHNIHLKDILEWGTMKNYMTTQKYIALFLKTVYKVSDIPLAQLSYSFLVDLEIFLKGRQPAGHHKPCGHNTVLKHIERLRKMINLAIKNEWIDRDPFAKYQLRFIRKDREFLTEEELNRIENKAMKIERLQWAKDLFIFSCYTGLAYCDVMSLTKHSVSLGIDGEYWIMTARKKTHQSVRVPILPTALSIIEKYKNHPRALADGKLFPGLSNQKLNAYLKEIADLCEIEKNLTFHLARHTFATTVTLTNGVPIETVSRMLGHTSIRTTQVYAKVIEKKVSEDMNVLRAKLSKKSFKRLDNHSAIGNT